MALALFDLDNTLLAGDSDHAWGIFLAEIGVVDPVEQQSKQDWFYRQYMAGELDMDAFLAFQLKPLASHSMHELLGWREQYLDTVVQPMIKSGKAELIEPHRDAGDDLLIITATNDFITRPIADRLGVPTLLATRAEMQNDRYTGRHIDPPCYQHGKVVMLLEWLAQQGREPDELNHGVFYSDSYNDLPLLEAVGTAIAVTPDERLREHAEQQGWKIID